MGDFRAFIILIIVFVSFPSSGLAQETKMAEECEMWFIESQLFNGVVSDSSKVRYWENYWYERDSEGDAKLFPDTLIVSQYIIPGMDVFLSENNHNVSYRVVSKLFFKCGSYDESYNVFNPRLSSSIVITDTILQTKAMRDVVLDVGGVIMLPAKKIPMVSMLRLMNVTLQDGNDNASADGKRLALNQILINTSYYDSNGVEKCSSEFLLPVNGCYGDPNSGKWGEY